MVSYEVEEEDSDCVLREDWSEGEEVVTGDRKLRLWVEGAPEADLSSKNAIKSSALPERGGRVRSGDTVRLRS